MRLKIKIMGGLLGNAGKNRASNLAAVIQFRCARGRIVKHDESYKLRMVSREIATKRNDILSVVISAVRIDFLRRPSFPGNRKPGHSCGSGGPLIAHNAAQRVTKLFGSFRRDHLA